MLWSPLLTTGVAQTSALTQLSLPDLSGQMVKPFEQASSKTIVFIFLRTDCPISNRYAPEIKRLFQKFSSRGVRFFLIYPGADESVTAIEQHVREYDYSFDALRDPQHQLVKLTGAQVTPEVAVFALHRSGHQMIYRGRIDDRFVAFGKMRPSPTVRDLERTLAAVSKGKKLSLITTTAVGCFIEHYDAK